MEGKRYSFREIVKEYLRDEGTGEDSMDKDTYEVYLEVRYKYCRKKIFNEIFQNIGIDKKYLKKLKVDRKYQFSDTGKEFIKKLLSDFKKNEIIRKQEYDLFLDKDKLEQLESVSKSNDEFLEMIEEFQNLFIDSGCSEEEAYECMKNTFLRYDVPKRRQENEILKIYIMLTEYLQYLNEKTNDHRDLLTNQEHVLWMDNMTECILKTLNDSLEVRDKMFEIKYREKVKIFRTAVLDKSYNEKRDTDRIKCDNILEKCKKDTEIMDLVSKLERAHEGSILQLIMYILNSNRVSEKKWDELRTDERDAVIKIFNVTYSTGSDRKYMDIKKSNKIIEELYKKVSDIIDGDKACLDIGDMPWARSKNEVLLEKALKECGQEI